MTSASLIGRTGNTSASAVKYAYDFADGHTDLKDLSAPPFRVPIARLEAGRGVITAEGEDR